MKLKRKKKALLLLLKKRVPTDVAASEEQVAKEPTPEPKLKAASALPAATEGEREAAIEPSAVAASEKSGTGT